MKKKLIVSIVVCMFLALAAGILEFKGYIWHNEIFAIGYQIRGLDVSHYQEDIHWEEVPLDQYSFVFIKATEGEDMLDNKFKYNWENAKKNGFKVGAYHFFVTSSTGKDQAYHFIDTVPVEKDSLPPVIDIEISTYKDPEMIKKNLTEMIDLLTEAYGVKPILYVTYPTYNTFVIGNYEECDIWIRDIIRHPKLYDNRHWKFWQYSNRGRVKGISTYVDLNVLNKTQMEGFESRE